jgi:hypothetical protein
MNGAILIFLAVCIAFIGKCGDPPSAGQSTSNNLFKSPCEIEGISYAPIGRIVRMDQMPLKERRDHGTHVLLDASGNVQFALQAPNLNLDPYTDDGKWYRVDGQRSPDHLDLFVVCAVSPSP